MRGDEVIKMMVRQMCTDRYEKIGVYCNFLEFKANEYEYIDYILNDVENIDYYVMDDDESDSTFIVYFYINKEDIEKVHNIKVVAKLKDKDEFEVGTLYLQPEAYIFQDTDKEKISDGQLGDFSGVNVFVSEDDIELIMSKLEVVSFGQF